MSCSKVSAGFHLCCCLVAAALLLFMHVLPSDAYLTPYYYDQSCPQALSTIRAEVVKAIAQERRMAASLIRLHFHDCFVQGCDGSLLLNDSPSIVSEQKALQNLNSVRGFAVVESIKAAVEKVCPGVVSCADILAVAARDSSEYVNGPTWTVKLGRRDSTTASKTLAEANLPLGNSDLNTLIGVFAKQGLTAKEMVTLSGSHTIGLARCITFRGRIYNETNIDPAFAIARRQRCPPTQNSGDGNLAPLDLLTPGTFDNNYYKDLLVKKGLLHSDQVLYNGAFTDSIVAAYSRDAAAFYADFAAAMVKMGDISPLTGTAGEIRKVCGKVN